MNPVVAPSSDRRRLSPEATVVVMAVVLAFADTGLSLSTSLAMAPESFPFLLTTVFIFFLGVAGACWTVLRLARLVGGRSFGPQVEGAVIAVVTLLVYELLRLRMARSAPVMLGAVVLLVAVLIAIAYWRRRGIGFSLVAGASLLAGAWAADALAAPGGNPTTHMLSESRSIWGGALLVMVLQCGWFAAAILQSALVTRAHRGWRLALPVQLATLVLVGGVWLAGTHILRRPDTAVVVSDSTTLPPSPGLPNILLIVLDTVRADRTDLVDPMLDNTPSMLALGNTGTIYSQAYANSTWSLPSHATLFTGLYPHRHGAGRRIVEVQVPPDDSRARRLIIEPVPLAEEHDTLAELSAQDGYATAAFAANHGFFSPVFGLLQGFAHVESEVKNTLAIEPVVAPLLRHAPESLDMRYRWWTRKIVDSHEWVPRALTWIDERPEAGVPFFLFMNWMDAHERLAIAGRPGLSEPLPDRGAFSEYDTSLRHQDEALRQMLDGLRARGLLANTLVVVTSDHGEVLTRTPRHGGPVRQDQVWVPLVISGPGVERRIIADPVQLADIPAWILDTVGTLPTGIDGTALDGSGTVLAENYFARSTNESGVTFENVDERRPTSWATFEDGWKLFRDARGHEQLFDIRVDPKEQTDQIGQHPEVAARLGARLNSLLPPDLDRRRLAVLPRDPIDDATIERLRSLGYVR